tara:strand:+ start:1854 stop:3431 length:1578 start_codon:yes stop_codon:yes gene_type:complete
MVKVDKKIFIVLFVSLFLLFLKTNFRLIDEIYCCGDDHDYFVHASTIAEDFDFNYDNQLKGNEEKRYNNNGKIAPKGFVGSGILSAPFVFLGNILDSIFSGNQYKNVTNYKLLMYSFSSIFYLFLSVLLIQKSLVLQGVKSVNYLENLILVFGSGVGYFALERYSMTHTYEVFTASLLIYLSTKLFFEEKPKDIFYFLLPICLLLCILVRWVNYYMFFLPIIILFLAGKKISFLNNKYIFISMTLSISVFLFLSKQIYGIYTFDPQTIYGLNVEGVLVKIEPFFDNKSLVEVGISSLLSVITILFSQEFGLVWFGPVIAFSFLISIYNFVRKINALNFLVLISYLQCFGLVIIWGSAASSYGFRYMFGLTPLAVIVFKNSSLGKSVSFNKLIMSLSIFSLFGILFFSSTEGTQLSLNFVTNSFGNEVIYAQPNYLSGFLSSIFDINAYLKIFATSFFGFISFSFFIKIFGVESLNLILENIGVSNSNAKIQELIKDATLITYDKIIFLLLVSIILGFFTYNKFKK